MKINHKLSLHLPLAAISIFFVFGILTLNAQWPDKHGPTFDGVVSTKDAENLPVKWSDKENIAWKIPLEGKGHSTPVIFDNKIWLTSATLDGKEQYIYCINQADGKIIHFKKLFQNEAPEPLGNNVNSYATPSCVVEKGAVYVHFGTYGTARLNPETAEVIWSRTDIKARHFRGPASSPVLYKNLLILTFDAIDKQFLTALNKESGETVWTTNRSVDYKDLVDGKPKLEGDFRKAFGTPGLAEIDGKTQILSVGSKAAYGYDAETGKELWIFEHKNYNAAVRPLYIPEHHIAVINTGSNSATLHGIKINGTTSGQIMEKQVLWSQRRASSYCLPIYYKDHLYQITHDGNLSCTNIKTGEVTWKESLVRNFMASPILAGDKIYIFDVFGKATIFKAESTKYSVVAENDLNEETLVSPAVIDGALFIRGKSHLFKISKQVK